MGLRGIWPGIGGGGGGGGGAGTPGWSGAGGIIPSGGGGKNSSLYCATGGGGGAAEGREIPEALLGKRRDVLLEPGEPDLCWGNIWFGIPA